jgi:hypothetical protein
MDILELPFHFIRLPNFKLRLPTISQPRAMTMFFFVAVSYFLVLSGLIYDIIVEPPSIGSELDPVTKQYKPVAFLQWRVNGKCSAKTGSSQRETLMMTSLAHLQVNTSSKVCLLVRCLSLVRSVSFCWIVLTEKPFPTETAT